MAKQVKPKTKKRILNLHKRGDDAATIATTVGVSELTVVNIISELKNEKI